MGIITDYIKRKYGERKWFWVMDWILQIALAIIFVYFSFVLRDSINECQLKYANDTCVKLCTQINSTQNITVT